MAKIKNAHEMLGVEYKILVREPPFTIHIGKIDTEGLRQGIFVEDDIYIQKLLVIDDVVKFETAHLKPYYRTR